MQDKDYDGWKNRVSRLLRDVRHDEAKYPTFSNIKIFRHLYQTIRELEVGFDMIQKKIGNIDERLNEIEKK